MLKSARSKAEGHFSATQRKDEQDLREKEEARQQEADHTAKLRGLRLAKEVADKRAAEEAAAEKAAAKSKKSSRPRQAQRQ